MKARLGLVVPALTMGGGVPAVARFISDVASRDGRANLKLVSLSMDSRDPQGLRLGSPRSWLDGTRQSQGTWNELPYTHVGAVGADVEFHRYRSRKIFRAVISVFVLILVVCGT